MLNRNENQMLAHKRRVDADRKARAIEAKMARNRAAMRAVGTSSTGPFTSMYRTV